MPEQQEWWEGDLAELTSNIVNGDYDSRDEMLKCILAEHRKRVVREIRNGIEDMILARNSPWAIEAILALPCLKENE